MIDVKNIAKVYRAGSLADSGEIVETKALKDVSFSIDEGEFAAIMGPSGSGKSTLMHILGCLDTPTSGKYFFEGQDVSELSDDQLAEIRREKIGFVFQSYNLLPRASVLQNVMLPLVYEGVSKKEREEMAKKALFSAAFPKEFWSLYPNQLSGGMAQRVAIARALVNNPKLIFADEPTGNLDSRTGDAVLETFDNLNKQGRTIVLVTHEKYIAQKAKRIIRIRDGSIVEDSSVRN